MHMAVCMSNLWPSNQRGGPEESRRVERLSHLVDENNQ